MPEHATIEKWWAVNDDDENSDQWRLSRALDRLVEENRDRGNVLPAFLAWVRSDALSQEMYAEALYADSTLLDPLLEAFTAGWHARSGEAGCA